MTIKRRQLFLGMGLSALSLSVLRRFEETPNEGIVEVLLLPGPFANREQVIEYLTGYLPSQYLQYLHMVEQMKIDGLILSRGIHIGGRGEAICWEQFRDRRAHVGWMEMVRELGLDNAAPTIQNGRVRLLRV